MLKRYLSIRDVVRDLRRVKKSSHQLIAAISDDGLPKKSSMTTYNMRSQPGTVKMPDEVSDKPKGQISGRQQIKLTKEGNRYAALLDQQKNIRHIINSINTEFSPNDHPELAKMKEIAERINVNIDKSIETAKIAATKTAKNSANPMLMSLAEQVASKLKHRTFSDIVKQKNAPDKKINGAKYDKHETVILSGMVNDKPQHTVYLVYHNVKSDSGQISAQNVFAISLVVGKTDDELYIQPAMHTVKLPGQFYIGREIPIIDDKNKMANLIVMHIEKQLEADEQLIKHHALPIPVTLDHQKLKAIHTAIGESKINGRVLEVKISKVITQRSKINEITDQIYRMLFSQVIVINPKIRITRVVEPLKNNGKLSGWLAKFIIIPAGKISGHVLDDKVVEQFRNSGLPANLVNKIRHLIEMD